MTASGKGLQSALREWRSSFAVWAGLSVLATLAGPFGTMDALALLPRAIYWACVIAVAIVLDRALARLGQALPQGRGVHVSLVLVYAVIMASLVWLLNSFLFAGWGLFWQWAWLVFIILVIAAAVHALLNWVRPRTEPHSDTRFLERLPVRIRGQMIRLEAQDHYLLAVTENGADLILMRMSDAETELGVSGLRVHRSHWVARDAIRDVQRKQGRINLVMADGALVPVSRGYVASLKGLGLLP